MCLRTSTSRIYKLKKDRVCWKVGFTVTSKDGVKYFKSHVKRFLYEFDKEYGPVNLVPVKLNSFSGYGVFEGFHAFVTFEDAESFYNATSWQGFSVQIIVKCIIPAGSDIIKSYIGDEIVASRIIIQKIV